MRTLAKISSKLQKKRSGSFFKFLEVVFDLLVPVVIAQIIDVGIANNDHGYIVQKFFILILMAACQDLQSALLHSFCCKSQRRFCHRSASGCI